MNCNNCKEKFNEIVTATITDKNGSTSYCMNCVTSLAVNDELKLENNMEFIDDITGKNGAVKYENLDEHYTLEKDTMRRLICNALEPEEYFALVKLYGASQFQLHSDFYDSCDGVAEQPLI